MTEQEAINYYNNVVIDTNIGVENIATTTEIINISIKALEKQIPKEPIDKIMYKECPICGAVDLGKYCPECGQALKLE